MNAPRRWKDSPAAPVGVRELLSAARPTRAIPEETFARGVAKVAQRTVVPVAAVTAIGLWTKIAIAGVALVAVTGGIAGVRAVMAPQEAQRQLPAETRQGVVAAPNPRHEPQAIAGAAPKVEVDPPAAEPAPAAAAAPKRVQSAIVQIARDAPVPEPIAVPTPIASAAPEPAAEARATSTLASELALLESAQRAVARDPARALAGVAQHRAQFPAGMLGAERDLVELDALKRLGRNDEAKARADAWLAREPAGVYAQRVKTIRATLD